MFIVAIALLAVGALVTASRRFITKGRSRFMALLWQVVCFVVGLGVLTLERTDLPSLPRGVVVVSAMFVLTVLLDAVGVSRMVARSLGG